MNRRRPITCRRSDTQILLRGTARRAERVVKPWGTDLSGSLQWGSLGSVPVSPTASPNESRT